MDKLHKILNDLALDKITVERAVRLVSELSESKLRAVSPDAKPINGVLELNWGDVIINRRTGEAYIVMSPGTRQITAVRAVTITYPGEWELLKS